MKEEIKTKQKKALKLMATWVLCLLIAFTVVGFIHETTHGFIAWLGGDSVSTGFIRVGNPYTVPGDPDFRSGFMLSSRPIHLFNRAAGTFMNLLIASLATFVLLRLKNLSLGALIAGAAVVAGTIFSIVGGIFIFIKAAVFGVLRIEDESILGLELAMIARGENPSLLALEDVIYMPLNDLVFSPWFWLPVIIPFGIALACYQIGLKKFEKLFAPILGRKQLGLYITGMIVLAIIIWIPIVTWLDQVLRINW